MGDKKLLLSPSEPFLKKWKKQKDLSPYYVIYFNMQAKGYSHAFQSTSFTVRISCRKSALADLHRDLGRKIEFRGTVWQELQISTWFHFDSYFVFMWYSKTCGKSKWKKKSRKPSWRWNRVWYALKTRWTLLRACYCDHESQSAQRWRRQWKTGVSSVVDR